MNRNNKGSQGDRNLTNYGWIAGSLDDWKSANKAPTGNSLHVTHGVISFLVHAIFPSKNPLIHPSINPNCKATEGGMMKRCILGMGCLLAVLLLGRSGNCYAAATYEAFGIPSKGEKVMFVLAADDEMAFNSSYSAKKKALLQAIRTLPHTYTFNVAVYCGDTTQLLFPELVQANEENLQKVEAWLKPLNELKAEGSDELGLDTLGEGGQKRADDVYVGPFDVRAENGGRPEGLDGWFRPVMLAMKMQADSVYLLTAEWGTQQIIIPGILLPSWRESREGKKWTAAHEKSQEMFKKENEKRLSRGQPPRVVGNNSPRKITEMYFPNLTEPPDDEYYEFSADEYVAGFLAMRDLGAGDKASKSKGRDLSLNVVLFMLKGRENTNAHNRFEKLTRACNGTLVAGNTVLAEGDEFRVFTSGDGRAIRARVIACNPTEGKVQIERSNGAKAWLLPDVFSDADQQYVRDWLAENLFLSKSKLRVSAEKKVGTENESGTSVHFVIHVDNRTGIDLAGLAIDYRLYVDVKRFQGGNDGKRCVAGTVEIGTLADGQKVDYETTPERLIKEIKKVYEAQVLGPPDESLVKMREDDLQGAWFRIRGPVVDGVPALREFCIPTDLNEKVEWIETPLQ